jgi:trk system potassium uptake protein TrkA
VKVLVIGCGRVGSGIAKRLAGEGWDVTVIDERDEALQRLGAGWKGEFVVGHGMDTEVLLRAGIEDADAVVVATNGDNTNIVVAQVAQRRYGVDTVVVRILDPLRAEFYAQRGMRTFCPTQTAISELTGAVLGAKVAVRSGAADS